MKHTHHVLVVDDDSSITELLCAYLKDFGYATHAAADGHGMRRVLAEQTIDLIVLDLQLPGDDGLSLTRELRQRTRIPIVMLTGRGTVIDRILGLELGADDYLIKPFEPRELVARIQTVLRRTQPGAPAPTPAESPDAVVCFDGWRLQREHRHLTSPQGTVVPLSNAEYQLLSTFLKTPRKLFTRDQLMTQARGREAPSVERSIDLLVSRLRQKLADDPRSPTMIRTVRGEGYVFQAQSVQWQRAGSSH